MKQLLTGNEAAAEAALQAGCRHYYGYPITPQNELINYMSVKMPQLGGTFIQAESEIAAISMVHGSAAAGARTMTSSSSPGISLKQEGISYLAGSELPCVIVNIQRGGTRAWRYLRVTGRLFPGRQGWRAWRLSLHRACARIRAGNGRPCVRCLRPCRPVSQSRHDPGRRPDRAIDGTCGIS